MADTLVATIEGPLGRAELYEVERINPNGSIEVEYEVRTEQKVEKFAALGAAYITAGEVTGAKT
jgi:hypothetical protein